MTTVLLPKQEARISDSSSASVQEYPRNIYFTVASNVLKDIGGEATLSDTLKLHCYVSEEGFKKFPTAFDEQAARNKFDSIYECLRAFAADQNPAPRVSDKSKEKLVRSNMISFAFAGKERTSATPWGSIDIEKFRQRMCARRTATLSEDLLISEMVFP